jgi:hypothetical protein
MTAASADVIGLACVRTFKDGSSYSYNLWIDTSKNTATFGSPQQSGGIHYSYGSVEASAVEYKIHQPPWTMFIDRSSGVMRWFGPGTLVDQCSKVSTPLPAAKF